MSEDTYGRIWPEGTEVCPVCGQPDNCGDCTHDRLTSDDARELGALTGTDRFTWSGWFMGDECSPEEPGKQWLAIEEEGEEYAIIVLRTDAFERMSDVVAAEAAREVRAQNICRALNAMVEAGDYA